MMYLFNFLGVTRNLPILSKNILPVISMGEIETQIFHNLGALIMGYLLAVFMEYFDLF